MTACDSGTSTNFDNPNSGYALIVVLNPVPILALTIDISLSTPMSCDTQRCKTENRSSPRAAELPLCRGDRGSRLFVGGSSTLPPIIQSLPSLPNFPKGS